MTLGVPRIKEIVNASKTLKTPQVTVYLEPPLCYNEELANQFRETLPWTLLADLVQHSEIVWAPENADMSADTVDMELLQLNKPLLPFAYPALTGGSNYILRFVLDQDIMMDKGLEPVDIARCIQSFAQSHAEVIYSEANMEEWVVRVRLANLQEMLNRVQGPAERKHTEKSIMQREHQRFLNEVVISGISQVTAADLKKVKWEAACPKTGALQTKEEWAITVHGPVLQELLQLDGVDTTRTISNNPVEVAQIFGIETAVNILLHEIQKVLSFDGTYVNARHIMTLVNTMTHRDFIMPMTRHGINRVDFDLLLKASFEESVEILFEGASYREQVNTKDAVSANVILGQQVPLGTGSVTLIDPYTQREIRAGARAKDIKADMDETLFSGYPVETVVGQDTDFVWYDPILTRGIDPVFRIVPVRTRPLKRKRNSPNTAVTSLAPSRSDVSEATNSSQAVAKTEDYKDVYDQAIKNQCLRLGKFLPSSPLPDIQDTAPTVSAPPLPQQPFVPSSPPPLVSDQGVNFSELQGLLDYVNRIAGQ